MVAKRRLNILSSLKILENTTEKSITPFPYQDDLVGLVVYDQRILVTNIAYALSPQRLE